MIAFAPIPLRAQGVTVVATVDRTQIGLGEDFTLSVEISGRDAGEPRLPELSQFAQQIGRSSSQSFQFINGRMSSSTTINYTYLAQAAGTFEIGPVEVEVNGEVVRSKPIRIEIAQAGGATTQQQGAQPGAAPSQPRTDPALQGGDAGVFLKAELDRARVYQNEPVVISYKIYTLRTISSYSLSKLPNFAGFWVENFELPRQPQTRQEVINGQRYLVAEIKRTAVFPQSAGKLTLEPMTIACEVQVQGQRRRSRDLFESFFDDPFFQRTVQVEVASKPVTLEVLPLPANKPANFDGAVGVYSLKATVDRREAKTNEAITLKVTASGQGNIKTLSAPRLTLPRDFEVYDPKVAEDVNRANNQISGSKTWEYVMVPRFPGTFEISGLQLPYFDPRAKEYRVASTAPIALTIAKGAGEVAVASGGMSKEDVKLIGQDIRFIALAQLPFEEIGQPNYAQPEFVVLLALPLLGLAGAFFYQRHQQKLSTNVAYARGRKATRVANKQLQTAKKFLLSNDGKQYYAEVQRALMGFLGNKLNVAEASLVTDDIQKMLEAKNVTAAVAAAYISCLHTCDFQRFAPSQSNGVEMKQFYDQAQNAIAQLEEAL